MVSIATARTRSSPRCCWTSQTSTSLLPAAMSSSSSALAASGRLTVIAWLISGSLSGNTASITTPWISSIVPVFCLVSASLVVSVSVVAAISGFLLVCASRLAEPFGAGDDFHDLLRDLRLAGTVHLERVIVDQVLAFSEALRIAVIRAPCSDAVDSSSAR